MRRIMFVLAMCFCTASTAFSASISKGESLEYASAAAWEQVGHQAMRQVNWDWVEDLEDWIVVFGPGRIGYHGLTELSMRRITIWIRSTDSAESVAGTIVHEVAHAFDREYLTPALRVEWLTARGLPPDTPWYFPVGSLSTDYLSGAGDFAESVRWTLQGPGMDFRSCLGLVLNNEEKKRIAKGCNGPTPDETQQALIRQWLEELPRAIGE